MKRASSQRIKATLTALVKQGQRAQFDDLDALCFGPQRGYVEDRSDVATACTTRRAGKTVGDRILEMKVALLQAVSQGVTCFYIAQTRGVAEELMWRGLKRANEHFQLGGRTNDTKLTIEFPNGARIKCAGAKDKKEADKLRGYEKVALAIIDEAQNFRDEVLEYLVNDVLEPQMMDIKGSMLRLTGTPGPIPEGFFWKMTQNPEVSHHSWSFRENPHLGEDPDTFIAKILKRRSVTIDDPTIQREFFGRWVQDKGSLLYQFEAPRNVYHQLPDGNWSYVFGIDIGYDDSDAIAVLGWREYERQVYLVAEYVESGEDVTDLANAIKALQDVYNPVAMVIDQGGGGKKDAAELANRHGLALKGAEKAQKETYIKLLNADLRKGALLARGDSVYAGDCRKVQKDPEELARGRTIEKSARKGGFHSDICDAVLYGWREAAHWLEEPAPEVKSANQTMREKHMAKLRRSQRELDAAAIGADPQGEDEEDFWAA